MLSISWSYRCQKYTASTFSLLVNIFVRLMMVSIILPSRQRDTLVFKYKLRMVPMWVICNSNLLEQLNTKAETHMLIELWHFNSKWIKEKILAISAWDESSKSRLRQLQHIIELETYIIDTRGISYGSLGACHMWRTVFGESGIHFGWYLEGRKSYGAHKILEWRIWS